MPTLSLGGRILGDEEIVSEMKIPGDVSIIFDVVQMGKGEEASSNGEEGASDGEEEACDGEESILDVVDDAKYSRTIDLQIVTRVGASKHRISNTESLSDIGISDKDFVYFCTRPLNAYCEAHELGITPGSYVMVKLVPKIREKDMITVTACQGDFAASPIVVSQYANGRELKQKLREELRAEDIVGLVSGTRVIGADVSLAEEMVFDGAYLRVWRGNLEEFTVVLRVGKEDHVIECGPEISRVGDLRQLLSEKDPPEWSNLVFCDSNTRVVLEDTDTLEEIAYGKFVHILGYSFRDKYMIVHIGPEMYLFHYSSSDTIRTLKAKIRDLLGIPMAEQDFELPYLSDGVFLSVVYSDFGDTIALNQRVLGSTLHILCGNYEYECPMSPDECLLDALYTVKEHAKRPIQDMRLMIPAAQTFDMNSSLLRLAVPNQSVFYVVSHDSETLECETFVDGFGTMRLTFEADLSVVELKRMIATIWNLETDMRLFLDSRLLEDGKNVRSYTFKANSRLVVVPPS